MRPAFHEDATIFGYVVEDLFAGPIQKLFDWNDTNGRQPSSKPQSLHRGFIGYNTSASTANASVLVLSMQVPEYKKHYQSSIGVVPDIQLHSTSVMNQV